MRFSYPYQQEHGKESILVEFPDVPGAVTEVREGEAANEVIKDCLLTAIGGYITTKKQPPHPSIPRGRPCVKLDIVTSAKLTLAMTMAEQGVSNVELAKRLGVNEKVVRRMLDPDHSSRIDRLEVALSLLGMGLELKVCPA